MRTETTGEQAITVRDVNEISWAATGRTNRTRHDRRPGLDVVLRVADDRRLSRRAGGRVDSDDLLARHRE